MGCLCALGPGKLDAAEVTESPLPETAVVSAYLVNFLDFIEWPEQAFASPEAPYIICIVGAEELKDTMKTMADGQIRRGRSLQAQGMADLSALAPCHVIYIDSTAWPQIKTAFSSQDFDGQLTVGRGREFLDAGGGISLVMVGQRLRFDVDRDVLEGSRLKIDSRLLDAANNVRQARRKGKAR